MENEILPEIDADTGEQMPAKSGKNAQKEPLDLSEALKAKFDDIERKLKEFDDIEAQRSADALKESETAAKRKTNMPLFILTLSLLGFSVYYFKRKIDKNADFSPFANNGAVNGNG